jgi:hypothetical protein
MSSSQGPTTSLAPAGAKLAPVALAGLAVYLLTAIGNVGIFAHDDYVWVMKVVLPAQNHAAAEVIAGAWIRNPVPMLIHLGLVKLANGLGWHHPLAQMRFDQALLGGIGFLALWLAGWMIFSGYDEPARARHRLGYAALLGFHFAAPFILTRPMFESLSAPFVALAAAAACRYHTTGRRWSLAAAVVVLGTGAMIRPQIAVMGLALPIVVVARRRWMDLLVIGAVGIAVLWATGWVDQLLRGRWHESLRLYFAYNVAHTRDFGRDPWYRFILLLAGLSIPPVFFARYRDLEWRARYQPLLPAVLMFALFVTMHSLVPHKEERFIVPVLPLFLLLLTPLAIWVVDHRIRWRIGVFAVVDGILLLLGVINPPQRTGMSLARFLDGHPELSDVVVASADILLPQAFVTHSIAVRESTGSVAGCGTVVAVLALDQAAHQFADDSAWTRRDHFEPGPLERLAILVNPRRNTRRGPIDVYTPRTCRYSAMDRPIGP